MARLPVIGGSDSKASAYNAGDPGSIPGSGRSPGEGNGNPLQYSCLENPMDGGAWWAMGLQRVRYDWATSLSFLSFLSAFIYVSFLQRTFRAQLHSVQFSCSVVPDSLRPHGLQHTRPPCPSPTPRIHPNPCPLSQWCHPTISSSVVPFSSHLQSFLASGFFQWVSSSYQVAKVLKFQLQHQSFQWTPRTDLL